MHREQAGFTLIEIAIVLVIIGLLLGGVLKGQELITSARVRNLISQQDGVKAAFFGFQDRYRALPGDYAQAVANIANAGGIGDGDGRIEVAGGVAASPREDILAWDHLSHSNFLAGNFAYAGAVNPGATNPVNAYGSPLEVVFDNNYLDANAAPPLRHNIKTGGGIPVEIIAEVERKVDDRNARTGNFRFSAYQGSTNTCYNGTFDWTTTSGVNTCGGADLL
jgi:prepilin-type N-terminal cleavage/methylation domain-containing protein